ncbi:MAG: mechanosensitive ion channel family protein [Candidatus Diapherotrites archaeon]|nr:mechanosensitive ion channel family protein [Candidatus Diapherotrites archaeon]
MAADVIETILRIGISLLVLVLGWYGGQVLRKKLIERVPSKPVAEKSATQLANRAVIFLYYLIAFLVAVIFSEAYLLYFWVKDFHPAFISWVNVVFIWIGAQFIIKNFSDVFEKVDDVIEAIDFSKHTHVLIKKFLSYGIYIIALMWTLSEFGLTTAIEGILVGAGFLGIVVGFAAKDVLGNLFAGITLIFDNPFKIGDWIELKGQNLSGTVSEVALRSTEIVATDNTVINIPNSIVANSAIINYTRNKQRKLLLPIGVAYESDIDEATVAIKKVLTNDSDVIKGKDIEVLVTNFAPSSVDLQVRVWVRSDLVLETKTRMLKNIKSALEKAGVEIPYPKQVLISEQTMRSNHTKKKSKKKK